MWIDRRRLVIGLAASLLVNVFLLGLVLGRAYVVGRVAPLPLAGGPLAGPRYVKMLPEDQKTIFQSAMAAHHEAIRAARRDHRELRTKVENDIAAPTFDRAVVAADLAALHGANRAVEDATSVALLDAFADLSAVSRAALVGRQARGPDAPKP